MSVKPKYRNLKKCSIKATCAQVFCQTVMTIVNLPFSLLIRAERDGCECMIPGKNESYLLMDGIPQENAVNLFFYETGCLLFDQSQYSKGEYALPNANSSLSRKIAGHSLSFLSQRTWGNFYGPMTTYAREYVLTELLLRLPLACALDEMEEFLAKARVSDMNVFQHAWREIAKRYRIGGDVRDGSRFLPAR